MQGRTSRLRRSCCAFFLLICLGSLSLVAYSAWISCQEDARLRLRDAVAGAAPGEAAGSLRSTHRHDRPTGVMCGASWLVQLSQVVQHRSICSWRHA